MELDLTEKELDHTQRVGNQKSGNERPRPIIAKFTHYDTRRKVFVNKKRIENTGISINESLTKHRMEFLKKAKNELIMLEWLMDEYVIMVRYIFTNYCGFLSYGKHKIQSFF